ncbi:MAG: hypothetical protein CMJ83_11040, partial [Planctomycetes bacterium]|nr:hypothetical protein [Planctomycetota bacterium]
LGAYLDLEPTRLDETHLRQMERILETEGMPLHARRRRVSAWRKFLRFLHERTSALGLGAALIQTAKRESHGDRLLLGLVALVGLRLCEIAALEGRDIRPRKRQIVSRFGFRIVPLHPWIESLFIEARRREPIAAYRPLLPGPNGFPVNARTLHSRFSRTMTRLGHPGLKPDTLRREASELLTRMGTPPGLVQAFLGKDRGRPIAPRRGRLVDLTCLRDRINRLPTAVGEVAKPAATDG